MLNKDKLQTYSIELFYKTYPPFAHITYESDTLFAIWKENFNYLTLMLNSKNFFQIRKFNKLRIKFLKSNFPEYMLLSTKPKIHPNTNSYFFVSQKFFTTLKEFIITYGFKSYYISNILSFDEHTLQQRTFNYFSVFKHIQKNKHFSNTVNTGLNFCINFYDNINLNKNTIPDDIIGFSLCQIYRFNYYNLYIGFNIDKASITEDDIAELSSIYLHEQAHSIDMALYCYLKKPRFLTNLFSSYKKNHRHPFYYKIYQEIFNSAYSSSEKIFLSESKDLLNQIKINLCNHYEKKLNLLLKNDNERILFIDSLESTFYSQHNKNSFILLRPFFKDNNSLSEDNFNQIFFDKNFFCYLYSKEKNFNLLYKDLDNFFINNYFHKNVDHQKYLLLPEEKFANTRFQNVVNPYTSFLFEELIREIFATNNPYFYF